MDFFTAIVDDPYAFGAIAAANALSDVYAMGGTPLTALSIAAFPTEDFPPEWSAAIVRGGAEKLQEAGCALLGGHSVRDAELKFGYAVTGLVDPRRMLTNGGGCPGDLIVLTKPLGTGVIATALREGQAKDSAVMAATDSMSTLNRAASRVALAHAAHAATDVTGFGLAGHAANIARESRLTLSFDAGTLPLLPEALALAPGFQSGGLRANRRQYEPLVSYEGGVAEAHRILFYDPQTSGGLLVLLTPGSAEAFVAELPGARIVGEAEAQGSMPLRLRAAV